MDYLIAKWLHVLSSTLLFGTGLGSAYYMLLTSLGARRSGDAWSFAVIEDEPQRAQVAVLFDALRKQIRQGYFELPLLAGGAR